MMPWRLSHRCDPVARVLADRHYNRQSVGAKNFVPPGRCLVLISHNEKAFWVTSWPFAEYVRHAWGGAWICSAFRSESAGVASDLIRSAIAATRYKYQDVPTLGMVTFVDRSKVKPTFVRGVKTWGWTYLKAGFEVAGETKSGLLALRLAPCNMPPPRPAFPFNYSDLFGGADDAHSTVDKSETDLFG